jgi:hypothetical protein
MQGFVSRYTLFTPIPLGHRKAISTNPFLRELVIPFGASGHVALFEIDDDKTITILAVRHRQEDDNH